MTSHSDKFIESQVNIQQVVIFMFIQIIYWMHVLHVIYWIKEELNVSTYIKTEVITVYQN